MRADIFAERQKCLQSVKENGVLGRVRVNQGLIFLQNAKKLSVTTYDLLHIAKNTWSYMAEMLKIQLKLIYIMEVLLWQR